MAKRTIVEVFDDTDGKPADETVKFGLDGIQYEIDLTAENATRLREALGAYVEHGTRVGRIGTAGKGRGEANGGQRGKAKLVRAWLAERGIHVSAKGRVPHELVAQYDAAHA